MRTVKETIKLARIFTDNSIKCKCSHTVVIPSNKDKVICDWCGNYVFKTPQAEFSFRLKERLIKNARKQ